MPRMGWASGTEGLTPKRFSESKINGLLTAEREQHKEAERRLAEEHATWGKSGLRRGCPPGTLRDCPSPAHRGGALKEKRET